MSVITRITDYEARLVALLPGQFQTQTNWLALISAIAGTGKKIQDQEDLVYSLWQQRSDLANAVGAQLAQWGELFGLPNQGWTDDSYRARILVWLQVLRSKGTPDELIRIAADMTGTLIPGPGITYWETPPASWSLQYAFDLYGTDPGLALDLARYLAKADPAGVGPDQVISMMGTGGFIFGTVGANGFSEAGGATRGLLSTDTATEAGV